MKNYKNYCIFLICFFSWQSNFAQCGIVVGDTVYVTSTNNIGGSLRNAINCVNDLSNTIRFIHFDIPGAGVKTITPTGAAPLPTITKNNVVIDARTQPGWSLGNVVITPGAFGNNNHALRIQANDVSIYGLTIFGFTDAATGAGIFLIGSNALVSENALIGNRHGVKTSFPISFTVSNNLIGVDPVTNAANGNIETGINILSSTGTFVVNNNTIAFSPTAIVGGSPFANILVSQNSIYCSNIIGINRLGFTVSGFTLNNATTRTISGSGPNGALIEVFIHDLADCIFSAPCQGKTLLGSTTVSGGSWSLNVAAGVIAPGDEITATATIGGNDTSEFTTCQTAQCPSASINFSNVVDACVGTSTGSATASVSIPGTYTYIWSNGQIGATATNLTPDAYRVTATDPSSCEADVGIVVIVALDNPSPNPLSNGALCVGESLLLDANTNNSTPAYTYSWTGPDGFTSNSEIPSIASVGLANAGIYFVTVTDQNFCQGSSSVLLEMNELPTFNLSQENVSCFGVADGMIDLNPISIVTPETYEWSNGFFTQNITDLDPGMYSVTVTDSNNCETTESVNISQPPALIISNVQTTPPTTLGGTDGMVSFTIVGGNPSYSYDWFGPITGNDNFPVAGMVTINNLNAGDYNLELSDNSNCQITQLFTIDDFFCSLSISDNLVTNNNCTGEMNGSIDVTIMNAAIPISYSWNNGAMTEDINNLSVGDYELTLTDATACEVIFNASITEPTILALSNLQPTEPSSVGGTDGSLVFDINGGTAPYAYSWSGAVSGNDNLAIAGMATINNLSAGDYTLMITDANNCIQTQNFTIAVFSGCLMSISTSTVSDVSCAGAMDGSIDITLINGNTPVTYNWNNGAMTEDISGLAPGNYALTVIDGAGCEVFFSSPITEPAALLLSNLQPTTPSSVGGNDGALNFNINGGTAPYAYNWSGVVNGNDNLAAAGMATINNLPAGDYTLMITDANNCMQTQNFTIAVFSGCLMSISASTVSDVSCTGAMDGSIDLTIMNATGSITYSWDNGAMTEDITNLSANNYALTATDAASCQVTFSAMVTEPTALIVSNIQITTPSSMGDNDGMLIFDINGGIAPYIYTWAGPVNGNGSQAMPGSAIINNLSAGTYTLEITDANNCLWVQIVMISEVGCTMVIEDTQVINSSCDGQTGGSINISINNATEPLTYNWTSGVNNDNGTGSIIADLAEGAYAVTITDQDGCFVTVFPTVNMDNNTGGVLNFIQGEEELCQGETLLLSTNVLDNPNAMYHWVIPNGDTINTTSANLLIENIQVINAGNYAVFVNDGACLEDETGPFNLTVIGLAEGEQINAGMDTIICDHQVQLNAQPINSGTGTWIGPTGVKISQVNSNSTQVTDLQNGDNTFIWTVNTALCGNIGSDTLNILVASGLEANDDFFTLQQANSEIFMDVVKNDGFPDSTAYTLRALTQPQFGTLTTLDNGFQYFESEGERGIVTFDYEVCFLDTPCPNSCATATVTIEVLNLPYLPEGFSPNDDGINDFLEVLGYTFGGDISMTLSITNRWGDIVYKTDDYLLESPWDGHNGNNSNPLSEGTYYAWLEIKVDGETYQQTQAIYLIK